MVTCMSAFPDGLVGKEYVSNAGDNVLIPGLERSPGGGNSNPLQYSCLENYTDREEPGNVITRGLQSIGSHRVGHNLATNTFFFLKMSMKMHALSLSTLQWPFGVDSIINPILGKRR